MEVHRFAFIAAPESFHNTVDDGRDPYSVWAGRLGLSRRCD